MGKISLKGLAFKAYHGYYDEEQEKGNRFSVDIEVSTDFEEAAINDDLNGTVDYEKLYILVQEEMQITSRLLESVVVRIANRVLIGLPIVTEVSVRLSKYNPPIGGACDEAVVTLTKKRA